MSRPRTIDWHEEEPRVRSVLVRSVLRRLAFPYVVTAVVLEGNQFSGLYVFSRQAPMQSVDDVLHRFPLVNEDAGNGVAGHVSVEGKVCMGDSMEHTSDPRAAFWNSNFRECIGHTGLAMWERLTELDPSAVLSVPLLPTRYTPSTLSPPHHVGRAPWEDNARLEGFRAEGRRIARRAFGLDY